MAFLTQNWTWSVLQTGWLLCILILLDYLQKWRMYRSSFRLMTWQFRLTVSKNYLFIFTISFSVSANRISSFIIIILTTSNILSNFHMHFYFSFYSLPRHFASPLVLFCVVFLLPLPLCLSLSFPFIFLLAFLLLTTVDIVEYTQWWESRGKKILNPSTGIWHLCVSKKNKNLKRKTIKMVLFSLVISWTGNSFS